MELTWETLPGHEKQILQLRKMLKEHRFPHAILLSGPKGVGKEHTAEVLAKTLLCLEGGDAPCGRCEACRAMALNQHPDFYRIEPEGSGKTLRNIRIEQLREMQAEIARLPLLSGCRVVLISQADRMNDAAENSLLKTLEEPTGQVYFLLVTHAPSSLLDTIRSRCMPVHFGMLSCEEIQKALTQRGVPPEQAETLALLADGSLGHGMRLAEDNGLALREDALGCLESLSALSAEEVFTRGKAFEEMSREQLTEWLSCQCSLLRDLLVLAKDGSSREIYHRDIRSQLLLLLGTFSEERIFRMLALLRETQRRLQANVNTRLLMEGMLLRWRRL